METPTQNLNEPHFKKSSCSYCGDAPVSHALFYLDSLLSASLVLHIGWVARHAPNFLKIFADWLPIFTFKTFVFFRLAHFSADLEKVKTFRSRVVWEEARRRGIRMEQLILFGKPMEYYRAFLSDQEIFFQSLPIPPRYLEFKDDWDNKFVLKEKFSRHSLPVPSYRLLPVFQREKLKKIFSSMPKPLIIKPKLGSRGRHTITNINTLEEFLSAVKISQSISPHLITEEHLSGYVCRATLVGDQLVGFFRAEAPKIVGDGIKIVRELIKMRDKKRPRRVEPVLLGNELNNHISRFGFSLDNILPAGFSLSLYHRAGRFFGGLTKEMLSDLHPSFIPIFKKAMRTTGLMVAGFDSIIPDPTQPADSQHWGIIECNTLPFIDLHYYALEGKPQNIAGMIWDLWR